MKLHIICIREDFFQKSPNCFATIPYANIMRNFSQEAKNLKSPETMEVKR